MNQNWTLLSSVNSEATWGIFLRASDLCVLASRRCAAEIQSFLLQVAVINAAYSYILNVADAEAVSLATYRLLHLS